MGRKAFRKEGVDAYDSSIRLKVIQLTLLEVFLITIKKFEHGQFSREALSQLDHLDISYRKSIYTHLHLIEKEAGRAMDDPRFGEFAFRKRRGLDAPDSSRIKAIENFLKKMIF